MTSVYLAGKVGHTDWRHSLFSLRAVQLRYQQSRDLIHLAEGPLKRDGFEYAGPYFLGDDHGCFHGENQHGLIDPGYADGVAQDDPNFPQVLERSTVLNSCLYWLTNADVLFCWIDSATAFGTLVEIGYAAALKKPMFLASPDGIPDMWFARLLAARSVQARSATDAWKMFVEWWPTRHLTVVR